MRDAALIVAGGRGERAGDGPPKQYRDLGGVPVIARTLARFAHFDALAVAIRPEHRALFDAAIATLPARDRLIVVEGGRERSDSVRAGLEALAPHAPDRVLIHDAARPFAPRRVIDAVLAALETHEGAIAAIPIVDALWREADGMCVESPPRAGLWRAQTPQGFRFETILRLHRANADPLAADDAALAVAAGLRVALVESEAENFKLTRPGDFARAARQMRGEMQLRVGTGFDVHAFGPGDHVMLCGVAVPHERGFVAHSDGDVALHALTDAVLGALALGDIGGHFPPSDPGWAGAESGQFLRHALALCRDRGFAPVNLDVTLICERPKVGPHVARMRARLAEIAGLDGDRVSVKATTSEKLGFTGRGEGIAAQAVAAMEGSR